VFALGAMFNPALASLEIPADGSFVALPRDLGLDAQAPPLQVAIRDKALLILAGTDTDDLARPLADGLLLDPPPLFAVDYGVHRLVQTFGDLVEQSSARLLAEGQAELALELRLQLDEFRRQAALYERLRVSVYASEQGLVMDQVMELR